MSILLKIKQGKTFNKVLRWETLPIVYVPIEAITKAAPAVITATGHGIPDGWRVAIESVEGRTEINSLHPPPRENDDPYKSDWKIATKVDADHISLNVVNSSGFTTYTSGGYIRHHTPVDLAGFTARMQIKDAVGGSVLHELTTENGEIVITPDAYTVALAIPASVTASFDWRRGVYDLEMISNTGEVTGIADGTVTVTQEVTT